MTEEKDSDERVLPEPGTGEGGRETPEPLETPEVWARGLWMLLFAIFYELGEVLLWICGLVQFFWMLFAKERNPHIIAFGEDLADWQARASRYISAASDDRPFPFDRWGKAG